MEIRRGDPLEPGDADGRSAEQRLKPKFGPKKKQKNGHSNAESTPISDQRDADHATRHCGDGVGESEQSKVVGKMMSKSLIVPEDVNRTQHQIVSTNPHAARTCRVGWS